MIFSVCLVAAHSWFVDEVRVEELGDRDDNLESVEYTIACEKWFSSQHDGGATMRTLPVTMTTSRVKPEPFIPVMAYKCAAPEPLPERELEMCAAPQSTKLHYAFQEPEEPECEYASTSDAFNAVYRFLYNFNSHT
jgi:hypothetical protein